MRAADAALVCELQDALRARVDRAVNRMTEAGHPAAGSVHRLRLFRCDRTGLRAGDDTRLRRLQQSRALLRRAEDDRTAAQDPRRHRPLKRPRIGRECHPRGHVGRHHPVLGDRDEKEIEEVALVFRRLTPGQQQMEVLREADPAHEVAAKVAAPHLDPVRVCLTDVADRGSGGADRHQDPAGW